MDPILLDAIEYNGGGGINTLLNRGAVKSVQRGYFQHLSASNLSVNITPVNPDRSVGVFNLYASGGGVAKAQLTSDKIQLAVVSGSANTTVFLSWQVIEFY